VTATEHSKEVAGLMRKLRNEYPHALEAGATPQAVVDPAEPLLGEFVRSFMIWESTTAKAEAVLKRMADAVVDFNELRVCLPDELAGMMGERYPRVEERALRLRAALNEIYHRQHAVTLEPLLTMNKRDAKDYLDSLEGVPRFVSARLLLLCLGSHAAPTDGRITRRLVESHVVENGSTPEAAGAALERLVRAGEMIDVYRLLQAWADDAPLTYSETPTDLPKRRESKPAAGNNHAEPAKKKPAARGKESSRKRG
jgi:endonuclease III